MHHIIEIVAFLFIDSVFTILLDTNAATSNNVNAALGADYSLKKLDEFEEDGTIKKVVMPGLITDTGSGGTR